MQIRTRLALLFLVIAAASVQASATGVSDANQDAVAKCKALEDLEFPREDLPNEEQAQALFACMPTDLYYGLSTEADFVKARHCAYISLGRDPESPNVLMMVYANGEGVARNIDMARKFTCEADIPVPKAMQRFAHLDRMAAGKPGAPARIDMCEHDGTDYSCKMIAATRKYLLFDRQLTQLQSGWSGAEKTAFRELRKRAREFIFLRSDRERDQSVQMLSVFAQDEVAAQNDDFLDSVRQFEKGTLPAISAEQLAQLEREMGELFDRLRQSGKPVAGRFNPAGLQATQEKWLVYRDQWATFGKLKYPAVAGHAWKGYFTEKRVAMFRRLLNGPAN